MICMCGPGYLEQSMPGKDMAIGCAASVTNTLSSLRTLPESAWDTAATALTACLQSPRQQELD